MQSNCSFTRTVSLWSLEITPSPHVPEIVLQAASQLILMTLTFGPVQLARLGFDVCVGEDLHACVTFATALKHSWMTTSRIGRLFSKAKLHFAFQIPQQVTKHLDHVTCCCSQLPLPSGTILLSHVVIGSAVDPLREGSSIPSQTRLVQLHLRCLFMEGGYCSSKCEGLGKVYR